MNYWMTTQWPNWQEDCFKAHARIWVKKGNDDILRRCQIDDVVFIYESKSGPIRIVDGEEKRLCSGVQGIVDVVKVSSTVCQHNEKNKYLDRAEEWWAHYLETVPFIPHLQHPIPGTDVNKVLGYKTGYCMRGFGKRHSGLMELTEEQGKELLQLCKKYNPSKEN